MLWRSESIPAGARIAARIGAAMGAMKLKWSERDGLICLGDDAGLVFEDTRDHWQNGLCRLLGLSDGDSRRWVEEVARASRDLFGCEFYELDAEGSYEALKVSWGRFRRPTEGKGVDSSSLQGVKSVLGFTADTIWAPFLPQDETLAVVGSSHHQFGWLIDNETLSLPSQATVEYDHEYFEGMLPGVGYGSHSEQETWRLEKAERYARQVEAIWRYLGVELPVAPNLLDVGSGYGFFRKAVDARGWTHQGLEISPFADEVSRTRFGFSSFMGDLEGFAAGTAERFDIVTMWDVVEHVGDPQMTLKTACSLLSDTGLLFLRTPNLDAWEREIFGFRYHSFKAEHLYYFGPNSIVKVLERAGFAVVFLTTQTHLLQGFLRHRLPGIGSRLKGSDLFVAAVKGMVRVI